MPKSFGSAIDFLKIPAINFVVYTNATAPAAPVSGQLWNDSANNVLKVYLSGAWVQIDNTGVAAAVHTHAIADVTGLQAALDAKAALVHTHSAADVTSGTLVVARGGTGTSTAPVAGGIIYGASTSAYASTAVGVSGQVLVSAGAGAPAFATLDMTYLPDSVFKKSVKAATTANITLSATQTIDGISLAAGDRVLVKDQTTTNQNGIYVVAAGAWTRVTDGDIASEIAGAVVSVDQGTVQGGQLWKTSFKTTDTLGTTGMVWFREVDSSISVTAGTGLTGGGALSGSVTLNVAYSADGVATAGTAVQATDSRLSNSRTPSGAAGGILTGTYPNPTYIATNGITDNLPFSAAMKDGAAGTATLRSLGLTAVTALAGNTRLDQIAVPTASVNLNSQKITGLLDPTSPQDAATKAYVDATSVGLDIKPSVRAASTGNVALTGTQTIDGVSLIAGDRVLLKDQTTGTQNGIYVVAAGAWSRSTDADTSAEVTSGLFVFVEEGTANDNSGWVLATNNPITLGTTALVFTQFSGAGSITAGNGLTQTGSSIDVVGTTNRISVAADSIDIAATYVGQTSITTLGTVTTGTWNATAVAVLYGGTGATTAAAARTNLGAVGKYAATLGALVSGSESTITHSLNSTDVQAMFRDASTGFDILFNWRVVDANNIGVTADTAYSASAVRVVVMG